MKVEAGARPVMVGLRPVGQSLWAVLVQHWPIVLISLATFAIRFANTPRPNDDAFITFRYVRNIVNGVGFIYNADERILGTTTPLYTLLLSIVHFPFKTSLPWLGLTINTLADVATTVMLWQLSRHFMGYQPSVLSHHPSRPTHPSSFILHPFLASLLFAFSIFSVTWAVATMETSLFTALLVGAFFFFVRRNLYAAAGLAALAALCRPEGVLMVGLVLAASWAITWPRFPWRQVLVTLAITLPWLIFATLYFGNPLPQSVQAKSAGVYIFEERGLARLAPFSLIAWDNPVGQFISAAKLPDGNRIFVLGLAATLLLLGLAGAALWRMWQVDRVAMLVLALFVVGFNGAYAYAILTRPVLIFDWYLVPLVPWYLLLIGVGLWQVCQWLFKGRQLWANVVLGGFVLMSLVNQVSAFDFPLQSRTPSPTYYKEAAMLLAPQLRPTDRILAPEIGVLGYYATAKIIDSIGLVSPETLQFYPVPPNELASNNAIPSRMVLTLRPEYVVSLELFVRNSLKLSPEFNATYSLLYKVPSKQYGSDGVLVYVRNDRKN